jgi:hypothetical protein
MCRELEELHHHRRSHPACHPKIEAAGKCVPFGFGYCAAL